MSAESPQRLPAQSLTQCSACQARVMFRARSSVIVDEKWRVVYLFCPACGHTATQMQEREVLPKRPVKYKNPRYKYTRT